MTTISNDVVTDADENAGSIADQALTNPEAQAFIDALHQLAQFLAEHPELPIPSYEALTVHTSGQSDAHERAIVDAAAKAMGVAPTANREDTHYRAEIAFGPLTYQVLAISAQEMADYHERNRLGDEAFEAQRQAARTADAVHVEGR